MKLGQALDAARDEVNSELNWDHVSDRTVACAIIRFIDSYKGGDTAPALRHALMTYLYHEDRFTWRMLNPGWE